MRLEISSEESKLNSNHTRQELILKQGPNIVRKTSSEILMQELQRICLPKLNMIMERQHFHYLEQEDECIINFKNRVRTKVLVCGFNASSPAGNVA